MRYSAKILISGEASLELVDRLLKFLDQVWPNALRSLARDEILNTTNNNRLKRIFTEHSRVFLLQYEFDDDQDEPISEQHHKAFYPFQFWYQYLIHHWYRVHEPLENKKLSERLIHINLLDGRYEPDNNQEQYQYNLRYKNKPLEEKKRQKINFIIMIFFYFCFTP